MARSREEIAIWICDYPKSAKESSMRAAAAFTCRRTVQTETECTALIICSLHTMKIDRSYNLSKTEMPLRGLLYLVERAQEGRGLQGIRGGGGGCNTCCSGAAGDCRRRMQTKLDRPPWLLLKIGCASKIFFLIRLEASSGFQLSTIHSARFLTTQ